MIVQPDCGWSVTAGLPGDPSFEVSVFTDYEDTGLSMPVPRTTYVVTDLIAGTLNDAVETALGVAAGFTTVMAFVANSYVDSPEVHVAYDTTEDDAPHEFAQSYQAGHPPIQRSAALLDTTLFNAVQECLLKPGLLGTPAGNQLGVAMVHYNEALRSVRPGGDVLVAEHLFMAAEALVRIVREREMQAAACVTDEQLLQHLGQPVPEYNANGAVISYLRRAIVFAGDRATHQALKKASDGFEHGFLSLTDIRAHLPQDIEETVRTVAPNYNDGVRATIFGTIDDDVHTPRDPTDFRELSFAPDLADLTCENGQLRLCLRPQITTDFRDGGSLSPTRLRLYRDLLADLVSRIGMSFTSRSGCSPAVDGNLAPGSAPSR